MTERKRMRMAELARLSGVSRETIHYYLREGLLPRPVKGGKTVAYYDNNHLERLLLIRRLREEKYLPLAVIRKMVVGKARAPSERDVETLSDVLSIDPTLRMNAAAFSAPDDESSRVALELGLLGGGVAELTQHDPTEQRVLSSVAEALGLEGDARQLTLADMRVCAAELSRLVDREAGLFFDLVINRGEIIGPIGALRGGRAAVAHFITAYRDLMLRRVVDDVLSAIAQGTHRLQNFEYLELSPALSRRFGLKAHQKQLTERALEGDGAAANDLVWHLFALGKPSELLGLSEKILEPLRPRARFLVSLVRAASEFTEHEAALKQQLARIGEFPLGKILFLQQRLISISEQGSSGQGFLELLVPVLYELRQVAPETEADRLALIGAFLRRGLIWRALPQVLGRISAARDDFEQALQGISLAQDRLSPASRIRLEANTRLNLARLMAESGELREARQQLELVYELDATGPLGGAAEAALKGLGASGI